MSAKRITPGTRLIEVEAALIDATTTLNRGATVVEVREAHAKRFPAMLARSFPRALERLEARGVAERIGGRYGRTQWGHVDVPATFVDPDDCAPIIAEAVETLYRKHGRALKADEVAAEVRRRGYPKLTTDQTRTRLETLAHTSARKVERTAAGWAERRVQRIQVTTAGGRGRVYWAPADVDACLPHFSDSRDAVRYAVGRAADAVGRPVTRREIRVWAKTRIVDAPSGSADQVAAELVLSSRFRSGLAGALKADEAGDAQSGRVRSVRTPLSSRGVYAPRFSTRTITPVQAAACLVEDLATLLRPESELESIEDLRSEAREIGSQVLFGIADARERALTAAVVASTPEAFQGAGGIEEACSLAAATRDVIAAWAMEVDPLRRRYPNGNGELLGFLRVARQCQPGVSARDALVTIDQTTGVAMQAFEALATEALAIAEREIRFWSPILAGARRIRGPITGGNSWEDPSDAQSFLDRPDAIVAIVGNCHLPLIAALVETATALLGHVVRDPDLLLQRLEEVGSGETMTRQAIVVALGLLGCPPPLEIAWVNPADADEAAAYYASIALGIDDEAERVRLAQVADRRARGAAMEISERATLEIEGGARLGVIG